VRAAFSRLQQRFIPAGAGNTARAEVTFERMPVYPRWRGEHFSNAANVLLFCGLSPLARGTPSALLLPGGSVRFIPAGAGNT
ncbi:hypothetical protein SEET535_00014, partial [Salmonella enterica subsp. enterica serovar Tennessee str. 4535]